MAEATMTFPDDFLWGTATASYQNEGNNQNSDWWAWEETNGAILHGQRAGIACNWWENAEADFDRAAELGTNALRLSLEWSRIEPEPSVFDSEALARYREMLEALWARGIAPMVTLHHFSNPLWLVEKGDFSSGLVVDYFARYTAKVVDALGDLVPRWITINEPMVYVTQRYLENAFPPPQQRGLAVARRALRNLLRCHAVAYHAIKERTPEAAVGVVKNMIPFDRPPGGNALHGWWADQISWLYNDWWLLALRDGRLRLPLGNGRIDGLADSLDFIGIDYFTRFYSRFPRPYERRWPDGVVVSDGGFGEVYPEGLFRVIKHARRYDKPLFITGNGLPDANSDLRPSFIISHLRELWRAVSFNWPVIGYLHWTLVDNFEWDRGWTQRFGLYALDVETQERTLRPGGRLYREICHANAISSDMAARYAPNLLKVLFPG